MHTSQTNTWNELRAKRMEEARALLEACARKEPKRHAAPLEPLQVQINKSQISNQQTTDPKSTNHRSQTSSNQQTADLNIQATYLKQHSTTFFLQR